MGKHTVEFGETLIKMEKAYREKNQWYCFKHCRVPFNPLLLQARAMKILRFWSRLRLQSSFRTMNDDIFIS
jgi:hypothetical protein